MSIPLRSAAGVARPAAGPRTSWWPALAVVLGFALLHAALFWIEGSPSSRRLWGDEIMYRDLAARVSRGEAPEIDPLWPPLYVWFLGTAEHLGLSALHVVLAQIGMLLLAGAALFALVRRFTGSARAALWASALFLLDPQVQAFGHYYWPEALHLLLFLGVAWLLSCVAPRPSTLLLAGLLLGLALLTKSLLLPFVPVLLLPVLAQEDRRRGLGQAALVLLLALLVVAPTLVGNGHRHGSYVIADSSRFNLWVGLNDRSRRNLVGEIVGDEYLRYRESGRTLAERNAVLDGKLQGLLRERGLVELFLAQLRRQYFRLFDKDSFLTDQLPGGAIAAQGYGYAGTPAALQTLLRSWSYLAYALTLAAAGLGLFGLGLRGHPGLSAALAFLAYNLLLFLGLHVKTRYRLQFLPVLELLAGAALAGAVGYSRTRLALGLLAALVLLGLAFAGPFMP